MEPIGHALSGDSFYYTKRRGAGGGKQIIYTLHEPNTWYKPPSNYVLKN